jgi:small-conductance mechanosensitive channel/CRP-like cAMP-binding protein
MASPPTDRTFILRQLLTPFALSVVFGGIIFYGSDAYQLMGLAALESTLVILGYALGIAEFLIIAVLTQRIVQLIILDQLIARALGSPPPRLLSQLAGLIIYALALAAIFGVVFKKDLTVVLATFGGLGIVVGLALRGMILDIFSGLAINLDQSIRIGDFIRIHRGSNASLVEGRVQEVSWRTTQILGSDNNLIVVPNNQLSSSTIVNYSRPENFFQLPIIITLDDEIPVEKALRLLLTAATEASPAFAPAGAPAPTVTVKAITLQGIEYRINAYPAFKTRTQALDRVQQGVLRHLSYAGFNPARSRQGVYDVRLDEGTAIKTADLASLLGQHPFFRDMEPSARQLLVPAAVCQRLPANHLVIEGGQMAEAMFLVVEGLLSAEEWPPKKGQASTPPGLILGPGSLIDAVALLAGGTCEATVRTRSEVLLYRLDMKALETLFRQRPEYATTLSWRVAEAMSQAIRDNKTVAFSRQGLTEVSELASLVFKHLRRALAHIELTRPQD